jgi:hypothetical protein
MCDVFDENLEKRQKSEQTFSSQKKKNPALLFEISKNTLFPMIFKFICDDGFLIQEHLLHNSQQGIYRINTQKHLVHVLDFFPFLKFQKTHCFQ